MKTIDVDAVDVTGDIETELAEEYPLATDHLVKGSTVAVEDIERAFGVVRDTKAYGLACMDAASYIERRFLDRGEVVMVRQDRGALRVLLDEEVPAYAAKLVRDGLRRVGRAHVRQSGADRSKMTDATRERHDRQLEVQGRTLSAITREQRREVKPPPPTPRLTPGLPGDES